MTARQQAQLRPLGPRAVADRRFTYRPGAAAPISLTSAIQDYVIDQRDIERPFSGIEAFTPMGHPGHYRVRTGKPYATGQFEFCGLADGFFVHLAEFSFEEPHTMSVTAPDMLRVRIASQGEGEYAPAHAEAMDIEGPSATIIIEPAGQPPADAAFAGRQRSVHVYAHRDMLRQLFSGTEEELPAVIQAFLEGGLQRTVARRLPLDSCLLRCLEDLHACPLEGHLRRLVIHARAIEILCHVVQGLETMDAAGSVASSAVTARCVIKAQRILMQNFVSPPSLDELARDVGMSRTSLCTGFRQMLGQSVYDYISDLRMQRALALLTERNTSITQIAYEVGYNYPSSFSVAVQRRFGATPRELRRRGALPMI